jgi:hypothetical protein
MVRRVTEEDIELLKSLMTEDDFAELKAWRANEKTKEQPVSLKPPANRRALARGPGPATFPAARFPLYVFRPKSPEGSETLRSSRGLGQSRFLGPFSCFPQRNSPAGG